MGHTGGTGHASPRICSGRSQCYSAQILAIYTIV